jgi:hypothetical protein
MRLEELGSLWLNLSPTPTGIKGWNFAFRVIATRTPPVPDISIDTNWPARRLF